ncbi:MAG TPA: regulatory protein RecX [Bacteroidia bacterium]|nr:regulatory protein RecX [Bacteroidia bacterium]
MNKRTKKNLSVEAASLRLQNYCAYTERTKQEVLKKMQGYSLSEGDAEIVMEKLIKAGFINETRFVKSFAGGKFRIKKWGKRKIEVEMKKKGISGELIEKGLNEVTENDYQETLDELLEKKWKLIMCSAKEDEDYEVKQRRKQKLMRYVLQKGYEMDIVIERIKKMKI